MTLAGLSIAYLRDRALHTALNIGLLALAVATMTVLALLSAQLGQRFERDARGVDLVVGAKGSPLQLILSAIYHVDVPTGNIPLETVEMLRQDPTVGEVIPLALGDSFRGFRIVGTEPSYIAHHGGRLAEGRRWGAPFEAVLGSEVAARTGAKVGQKFVGSHGLAAEGGSGHDEHPFVTVGVLEPTGTVIDRLILTSVESVWDVHGVAHGEDAAHHADGDEHEHDHRHEEAAAAPNASTAVHGGEPEVTALLVKYRSPLAAVRLPNFINRQTALQAAAPAVEITRLLSLVGVGLEAVRAFAGLLMLTGALSIFVALYTALRQREADMAMLRVMGARPKAIFGQVILEGLLLSAAGAAIGLALGHAAVAIAARSFGQLRDLGLSAARFEPAEAWIVAAALTLGVLAALIPALKVFRVDIADTLAHAR
ncbi:MAG: ABC transporter permease [Phenylobacterium sp.]|uniref:ABC transporter permease n=1 Tax=Phenylobacterium sp. TaxID=1871053 RepID=UPI00391DAB18